MTSPGKALIALQKSVFLYDVDISASYICKLQNGKQPPASDNVNRALAKVLGIDEEEFVLAAYQEKIPTDVLNMLMKRASQG